MSNKYIKSPLNYTGGKYKLLPQILPLFPDNISTFIDLFGGGSNVSINVNADKIIYNDLNLKVVQILETFYNSSTVDMLNYIDSKITEFDLSKTNTQGFLDLRNKYNTCETKNPMDLYVLICYAFNNQIRFNSKGEYNMPFGKNRSSFNDTLRQKFTTFCYELHKKNISFTNSDFREYTNMEFDKNTFIYCDPPYFSSTATYNEKNGWTEKDELDLYDFLCKITCKNVRWALSNNLSTNPLLEEFANKNALKIHYLNNSYSNCNYHKKDKTNKDCEVLITNY